MIGNANSEDRKTIEESHVFGSPEPNVDYTERRAAYLVILSNDGKIAMVKFRQKYFLPGGGSLPDESPEDTVAREVNEELARSVILTHRIGEATQYFCSAADNRHYKMQATFFAGEFINDGWGSGEHELNWLPVKGAEHSCFHACHAWAIRQASLSVSNQRTPTRLDPEVARAQ